MPAVSKAQLRWVNSPSGHKALGAAGVAEWNAATKGKHLPERVHKARSVAHSMHKRGVGT